MELGLTFPLQRFLNSQFPFVFPETKIQKPM